MAEIDFYRHNAGIFYPFISYSSFALSGGGGLALSKKMFVDAGFMLGLMAEFDVNDTVYLYSVGVVAGSPAVATFKFRSTASGLTSYEWVFEVPVDVEFGCTVKVDVSLVGSPDPDRGNGFVTFGDLSELATLFTGTRTLTTPPVVEMALLQNLAKTYVRTLNLANDARRCPTPCCESSEAFPSNTFAAPNGQDINGSVTFKPGYNSTMSVDTITNTIILGATLNAGEGPACKDTIIDENGMNPDPDEFGVPYCESCDEFIRSINGRSVLDGKLKLVGGSSFKIEPDPENHRIYIRTKTATSSSGSGD